MLWKLLLLVWMCQVMVKELAEDGAVGDGEVSIRDDEVRAWRCLSALRC